MMRRPLRDSKVMLLYWVFDVLVVLLCWAGAYLIRFNLLLNDPDLIDTKILRWGLVLAGISYLFFSHNDLYTSQRYFSWYREMLSVFKSHFQAIATTVILLYFVAPGRLAARQHWLISHLCSLIRIERRDSSNDRYGRLPRD